MKLSIKKLQNVEKGLNELSSSVFEDDDTTYNIAWNLMQLETVLEPFKAVSKKIFKNHSIVGPINGEGDSVEHVPLKNENAYYEELDKALAKEEDLETLRILKLSNLKPCVISKTKEGEVTKTYINIMPKILSLISPIIVFNKEEDKK